MLTDHLLWGVHCGSCVNLIKVFTLHLHPGPVGSAEPEPGVTPPPLLKNHGKECSQLHPDSIRGGRGSEWWAANQEKEEEEREVLCVDDKRRKIKVKGDSQIHQDQSESLERPRPSPPLSLPFSRPSVWSSLSRSRLPVRRDEHRNVTNQP